jgi:excinuclease UvrABC nuclease subunit
MKTAANGFDFEQAIILREQIAKLTKKIEKRNKNEEYKKNKR